MPFDENLSNRIRELLAVQSVLPDPVITEKAMFGGLCFMVNDKMCICVGIDGIMCRIGAAQAATEIEKGGCRQTVMGGRAMKDYVDVDDSDLRSAGSLEYWITRCLRFNPEAKAARGRRPGR